MKRTIHCTLFLACAAGVLSFAPGLRAENATGCTNSQMSCCQAQPMAAQVDKNVKPDLLTTCPVSGDKLGGDMGDAYVFTYKGQEVKLCCKDCKKDFDKNPEKYIAKIRAADKSSPTDSAK